MNTRERNLLLMEEDGFDCSAQAKELSEELKQSPLYQTALERLNTVSQSAPTKKLIGAYTSARDLNFDVRNMEDYAVLESRVLISALQSMPQWWVNPLNPSREARGGLNSIGQLFVDDEGKRTVDSLIQDERLCLAEKLDIVAKRVNSWHQEMWDYSSETLREYRQTSGQRRGGKSASFYLRCALLVIANIYLFCLLLIPADRIIEAFYHPDPTEIEAWVIFVPIFVTALYDIVFLIYNLITLNRDRAADYASKFANLRARRYMDHLDQAAQKLLYDLTEAVKSGITMTAGSLGLYASTFGEELDLEALSDEQKRRNRHPLTFLRALFLFSSWLCLLGILFSIAAIVILVFNREIFA